MPRKTKPKVLRANTSFAIGLRVIREGDLLPADSPFVKGREELFTPVEGAVIEQATAAPGEVRMVTPPKPEEADDDAESE